MPSTGNTANRPLQPGPSLLAASVTVSVSAAPIIARRINSAGYIGRSTAISPASRRERRIQAGKPYPDIDACIAPPLRGRSFAITQYTEPPIATPKNQP